MSLFKVLDPYHLLLYLTFDLMVTRLGRTNKALYISMPATLLDLRVGRLKDSTASEIHGGRAYTL